MDLNTHVLLTAAGVLVSIGTAYGLVKASLGYLKEQLHELKTDIKETRKEVAECDKRIAILGTKLGLPPVERVRGMNGH